MTKNKIGYCQSGGIFIGKDIQSKSHKHHSIAIIISFKEAFEITYKNNHTKSFEAAIIPANIPYKLSSSKNNFTAFFHLNPYSETGITITKNTDGIIGFKRNEFKHLLDEIKQWFHSNENHKDSVKGIFDKISNILISKGVLNKTIDPRIIKCIHYLKTSEKENTRLKEAAAHVSLSTSRLYHLFKQETGISFRQFMLHQKLIKSLQSINNMDNLTEAAFFGGFSDQPHFIKTFKRAFGIKPSKIKK